jgi:MFS family permease
MPATRTSPRVVLAVLAAAAGAFSMLQSLVSPVLPTIQHELHTDAASVTWVLTAWLLSAAVATPVLGRVGDMAGKERTLVAALAAVAVGSLIAAVAPTLPVLLVGRVVQGLGGAVFAVSFGIIRDELPASRVASAVGGLSAVIAVGGGIGIVLAGPIVTLLGWRWLFWIPLAAVAAVAVLAHRLVPESPTRTPGRINWPAVLLLSGGLVALLVPLSEAPSWGWGSVRTVGLLALAAVLLAGWVGVELRSATPLIDMRMMRIPAVWTTNLAALLFGAVMFGVYAFLPQLVQLPRATGFGLGESVSRAGLVMLPLLVTMAVAGAYSGRISRVVGFKVQLVGASLVGVLGCSSLAVFHGGPVPLAAAGALLGAGFGLAYAALASLIVQNVPAHQTGAASGMNANIRTIGGALGTAVVSGVITASVHRGGPGAGLPAESGFTDAFWVLAGASLVAALLGLLVPAARPLPVQSLPVESLPVESLPVDSRPGDAAVVVPVPAGSR